MSGVCSANRTPPKENAVNHELPEQISNAQLLKKWARQSVTHFAAKEFC